MQRKLHCTQSHEAEPSSDALYGLRKSFHLSSSQGSHVSQKEGELDHLQRLSHLLHSYSFDTISCYML